MRAMGCGVTWQNAYNLYDYVLFSSLQCWDRWDLYFYIRLTTRIYDVPCSSSVVAKTTCYTVYRCSMCGEQMSSAVGTFELASACRSCALLSCSNPPPCPYACPNSCGYPFAHLPRERTLPKTGIPMVVTRFVRAMRLTAPRDHQ